MTFVVFTFGLSLGAMIGITVFGCVGMCCDLFVRRLSLWILHKFNHDFAVRIDAELSAWDKVFKERKGEQA